MFIRGIIGNDKDAHTHLEPLTARRVKGIRRARIAADAMLGRRDVFDIIHITVGNPGVLLQVFIRARGTEGASEDEGRYRRLRLVVGAFALGREHLPYLAHFPLISPATY